MRYTPVTIRRHLSGYQRSGLSIRAYCAQHNLNYWTFHNWRKRDSNDSASTAIPFLKVDMPATTTASYLELTTASKALIRIPSDLDAGRVHLLLRAIKRSRLV
jgi:hypothetical protein